VLQQHLSLRLNLNSNLQESLLLLVVQRAARPQAASD
jgi:hypothetical protein